MHVAKNQNAQTRDFHAARQSQSAKHADHIAVATPKRTIYRLNH